MMEKKKGLLSLSLAAIMMFLALGINCLIIPKKTNAAEAMPWDWYPRDETKIIDLDTDPTQFGLFELTEVSTSVNWLYTMIYDRLIYLDEYGNIEKGLSIAEDWHESEDQSMLTLRLRNGVKFTDGTELTAYDVVAVVKAASQHPGTAVYEMWSPVIELDENGMWPDDYDTNVRAIDDYTIEFRNIKISTEAFLYRLGMPIASIINGMNWEYLEEYIGTGAFVVKEVCFGAYMILERNEIWWAENPVPTRYIVMRYIPEDSMRMQILQSGECDLTVIPRVDNYFEEILGGEFAAIRFVMNSPLALTFSMDPDSDFSSIDARQAIASCIDMTFVCERFSVHDVKYKRDDGTTVDGTVWNCMSAQPLPYYYDIGYVELLTTPDLRDIAYYIQEMLAQNGISAWISEHSPKVLNYKKLTGNQIALRMMPLSYQLPEYLKDYFHTNGSKNTGSYSNIVVDELFDSYHVVYPGGLNDLQTIIRADLPALNLGWPDAAIVFRPGTDGRIRYPNRQNYAYTYSEGYVYDKMWSENGNTYGKRNAYVNVPAVGNNIVAFPDISNFDFRFI